MLVDNGVHGDSRVQKTARSASDAGWDVVLVGIKAPVATEDRWQIGGAEVRLVPVAYSLNAPPVQLRASVRRPFAYPPGPRAKYRANLIKARRIDIADRRAALSRGAKSGRAGLFAARASLKIESMWTSFRNRELTRLRAAQQNPNARLTKATIAFWRTAKGPRSWRRLDPGLWDYELAFGRVIDDLRPDIIHANDFRMLGVGVRAAHRARSAGRPVKLLWDAHESVAGIMGRPNNPRWLPAQIDYVREYAPHADAVVTVSPTLSELLRDSHRLPKTPDVVLNAPASAPAGSDPFDVPNLRELCGIETDTPLLVYCGSVNPRRGLAIMVDALPTLPGVHVAFVTLNPSGKNTASEELLDRARALGVGDRVHLLPYVPYWQVAPFLSVADVGVIPIHHQPNHEIALITKFFEYSHARLPIVVSDVRTMAETVRSTGQGEVFQAEDIHQYVRAVKTVLSDPKPYRLAYDRPGLLDGWTWEAQVGRLDDVYSRLIREARSD
jgi:glycosyltransferase involved in cell wall biosynthesis